MSLNKDQKEYIRFLNAQSLKDLCWCGWYLKRECDIKGLCTKGSGAHLVQNLTCEDKVKGYTCPECKMSPYLPGDKIYHLRSCSLYKDE